MFWLVPRPASLKFAVSDPSAFSVPLALMKCGLTATAVDAATAKAPTTSRVRIVVRRTVVSPIREDGATRAQCLYDRARVQPRTRRPRTPTAIRSPPGERPCCSSLCLADVSVRRRSRRMTAKEDPGLRSVSKPEGRSGVCLDRPVAGGRDSDRAATMRLTYTNIRSLRPRRVMVSRIQTGGAALPVLDALWYSSV